jgi:pantetheine-phosphate adenylyltransferase
MKKIALFPGSFDPFTKGHESVLRKALPFFDEIVVGVGVNTSKNSFFSVASRINHIQSIYHTDSKVKVQEFNQLTVDYCKELHASCIIRGLRDTKDFEYEKSIAQINLQIAGIETLFFLTDVALAPVSATIIRELAKNGGKIDLFVTNSHLLVK